MSIKRKAHAHWTGSGKDGKGAVTTQSSVLNRTIYGYTSRFEDGIGTNPEELIAAAHAGCYTMKLAFNLQAEDIVADNIVTEAIVELDDGAITNIYLDVQVEATGLDQEKFQELALDAKENCPISKLMNATIHLEAKMKTLK